MAKRRKKNPGKDGQETAPPNSSTVSRPRPRRRFLVLAVSTLAALLTLVALAPTIVTRTALRDYVVAKLLPAELGLVSLTSLRGGWFSSLAVQDLKVFDPQGKPLLEVAQLELDRSMLDLVTNRSELGTLVATKPVLHLSLRSDGSNLEESLARFHVMTDPTSPTATPNAFAVGLKFVDATILAVEQSSKAAWQITDLRGSVTVPKEPFADWSVAATAKLDGQDFQVEITAPLSAANAQWPLGNKGKIQLRTDEVSLRPAQYISNRLGGQFQQLDGALSAAIDVSWTGTEENTLARAELNGFLLGKDIQVVAPAKLGPEPLRLDNVKLAAQAKLVDDVLTLEQCELKSELGEAKLQSIVNVSQFQDATSLWNLVRQGQVDSSGHVDLAAIAAALPQVLKIREDVQLASGQVSWRVKSEAKPRATNQWTGTLTTANVHVFKAGIPIDWEFPLELDFSASVGAKLELERLVARSDSFSFVAEGRLQNGSIRGQADLERLVSQLSEVLELDGVSVHGQVKANVQWNEAGPNVLSLDGTGRLTDFVMARHDQVLCREADLSVSTAGTAKLDANGIASLDSARMDVRSGGDSLVCRLYEPVHPESVRDWPIDFGLRGEIASWIARLSPFGISFDWNVNGTAQVTAAARVSQHGSAIQSLSADVRDFAVVSSSVRINEPIVQVTTSGTIDHATWSCRLPSATVASQTLSFAAKDLVVDVTPRLAVFGRFGYRADVGRLTAWLPTQSTTLLTGHAVGQLELQARQQLTGFRASNQFEDLRVVGREGEVWHEPKLTVECQGTYDSREDRLDLAPSQVGGKLLQLDMAGSATQLSVNPVVDFSGDYSCDLAALVAVLGQVLGPDLRFSGNQQQRFSVNGPVFPSKASKHRVSPKLVAQTSFGWDSASLYGVPLERGQLDMTLVDSIVQMNPLSLAVAGGRAQITPAVHVNSELLWMTLKPGPIAEQIRITREMSSSWMKYIAPLLAEATDAEGSFSVSLERAEVPLIRPAAGEVDGVLAIHNGAVRPGRLAIQLIELATQVKRLVGKGNSRVTDPSRTWIGLGEQAVPFQLAHGRVYHEGFEMWVDDIPIRTRGSVGVIDETISMIAEVAIPEDWIGTSTVLAGLRGRSIAIPVSGTLSRPELDRRGLSQLANQLVQQAAQGYIQEKVGGQLQKQLGGKLEGLLGEGQNVLGDTLEEEIGKQINRLFK